MGYIETLFGHQAPVLNLDALLRETAVSVGGRDKSVRFWKVPEESQLVFRGGGRSEWEDVLEGADLEDGTEVDAGGKQKRKDGAKTEEQFIEGSLECVAMIDEITFVSGGDSGCVQGHWPLVLVLMCAQFNMPVDDAEKETGVHAGSGARL